MTQEHFEWVRDNLNILTMNGRGYNAEQTKQIFGIYNAITGEAKKPTSCGRCTSTTIRIILNEYNKQL